MKIVSHRGFWKRDIERNTFISFDRAIKHKFGIETDIRDHFGKIVISHDLPMGNELSLIDLVNSINQQSCSDIILALNVKSDGMAEILKQTFSLYPDLNYYLFDISVPDIRSFIRNGLPFYSRMSEFEKTPVYLNDSTGVWLDSFETDWFGESVIQQMLRLGKKVCIVSPELHGRDHRNVWDLLKSLPANDNLAICTDYPDLAMEYFKI